MTHCDTLQHTATHCSTLQHTAAHCNTLQHTATHCNTLQHTATHYNTLQHTAAHGSTRQHTAARGSTRQHTAAQWQHTAAHGNTRQHSARECKRVQEKQAPCVESSTPGTQSKQQDKSAPVPGANYSKTELCMIMAGEGRMMCQVVGNVTNLAEQGWHALMPFVQCFPPSSLPLAGSPSHAPPVVLALHQRRRSR